MKNVLIIDASPRAHGNCDLLCEQFAKGAKKNGHDVRTVYLRDLRYDFCTGCQACQVTGRCVKKDVMNEMLPVVMGADVVVLASPVYYYSLSGQMKTFLDRLNPLYDRMKGKTFYFMITAQDDDKQNLELVMSAFEGFTMCFDNITIGGKVYGGGADKPGEIETLPAYKEAYLMGRSID